MTAVGQEVGRRLRSARIAAGLSMAQAAELLGVSYVAVSYWESGERRITVERLVELAGVYQVPVASLIPDSEGTASLPKKIRTIRLILDQIETETHGGAA